MQTQLVSPSAALAPAAAVQGPRPLRSTTSGCPPLLWKWRYAGFCPTQAPGATTAADSSCFWAKLVTSLSFGCQRDPASQCAAALAACATATSATRRHHGPSANPARHCPLTAGYRTPPPSRRHTCCPSPAACARFPGRPWFSTARLPVACSSRGCP